MMEDDLLCATLVCLIKPFNCVKKVKHKNVMFGVSLRKLAKIKYRNHRRVGIHAGLSWEEQSLWLLTFHAATTIIPK